MSQEEDRPITARQMAFCQEYIKDLNASKALIRAGYSARGANVTASQLLAKPNIQSYINELKARRSQKTEIDANYVLDRLAQIDQMDVADILDDDGNLLPIKQWPKIWRQYLNGIEVAQLFEGRGDQRSMIGALKKVKWPDKAKILETLGKHVSVGAFRENIGLTDGNGDPISINVIFTDTDE